MSSSVITAPAVKARISHVEHMYFQRTDEQPVSFSHWASSFWLGGVDRPYSRTVDIPNDKQPHAIDTGWITDPGFIYLQAKLARNLHHVCPTTHLDVCIYIPPSEKNVTAFTERVQPILIPFCKLRAGRSLALEVGTLDIFRLMNRTEEVLTVTYYVVGK